MRLSQVPEGVSANEPEVIHSAMAAAPLTAIIGTACRKGTHVNMPAPVFDAMCAKARHIIREEWHDDRPHLISGGAAGADHVAVILFLEGFASALTLELPAFFASGNYAPTQAGGISNHYHQLFSEVTGRDSRSELQQAIDQGATVKVHDGFFDRNDQVAQADRMLAFVWSLPVSGGTGYTWNKCQSDQKQAIVIGDLSS